MIIVEVYPTHVNIRFGHPQGNQAMLQISPSELLKLIEDLQAAACRYTPRETGGEK